MLEITPAIKPWTNPLVNLSFKLISFLGYLIIRTPFSGGQQLRKWVQKVNKNSLAKGQKNSPHNNRLILPFLRVFIKEPSQEIFDISDQWTTKKASQRGCRKSASKSMSYTIIIRINEQYLYCIARSIIFFLRQPFFSLKSGWCQIRSFDKK